MIEGGFLFLNAVINIWWGLSIFYSIINEHILGDVFWITLSVSVITVGVLQIIYFFVFPGGSSDVLSKPIGGKVKALTLPELLAMFRDSCEKEKKLSNTGCLVE